MQCVLLLFYLNCTCEPFSLLLGSMAFLCSGDCRRQPTSSSRWDLKVLPVKESKAACPPFLTDRENAPGLWSAKHKGEEELSGRGDGESSECPWLPAAPLPSRLCSPDGNLGEMKSTALPRCTMLVPTWFFFFF